MVSALLRLTEISAGSICLAGRDIRTMPLQELRRQIGYVAQTTFLFEVGTAEGLYRFRV